jgi:hypothetical protein
LLVIRFMVELYDFDDPHTLRRFRLRRSPLKRANAILIGIAVGLGIYASPILFVPAPVPRIHQGVEIRAKIANDLPWVRRRQNDAAQSAIDDIIAEMNKYPDGFLSEVCDLETVYVTGPEPDSPFIGHYSALLDAMQITLDPSLSRSDSARRTAETFVHEADHACNMTKRTLEDVARWDDIVVVPASVDYHVIMSRAFETQTQPPEGYASWYGMTSALTSDSSVRHVEDEATIKQLTTYGWRTIDARDDAVLNAKIDLLIGRYTDWSGGVMDEDYFRSWSVPEFSYADRHVFLDETHDEEGESLYEHADER